jgi:hypothetical protein
MGVYKISFLVAKIVMVSAVIALVSGTISAVPALADDRHGGSGHDRGLHKGERQDRGRGKQDRGRGKRYLHQRNEYRPEVYYPPVYAPEPVYVPPPPSPGINLIFPFHFR